VTAKSIRREYDPRRLDPEDLAFVDSVLEAYGGFTGGQLEELTRRELPWQKARGSREPTERCETLIDEQTMGDFYRARL
jgi:uncharacterized phage-associated protein